MSGNVVDLCPVGALTSKPYAFQARPWELKKTESVDVLDAVGSNVRVDSRGVQVMRIQPRANDDVNEEWISDKTRYAYDGLRFQRLTTPLVRRGDRFVPAGWADALEAIHYGLQRSGAQGDEIVGVAGDLADAESLVALKDFVNRLGSENLTLDQPRGADPPVHGVDFRASYLFNSTIAGLDDADAVLLVGTDPRHEAAIVNARLRRSYLKTPVEFGLVGPQVDLTFDYAHLGESAADAVAFLAGGKACDAGKDGTAFAKAFAAAKKPLIIVGSGVAEQAGGAAVYEAVAKHVDANKDRFLYDEWNGFSVLQRVRLRRRPPFTPSRLPSSLTLTPLAFPFPRPPRARPRTTSASRRRQRQRGPSPSLSTCSTPTRSSRPRCPRTRSSSTRATTATPARSWPTSACPGRPTPRRRRRGSTPRAGPRWAGRPSRRRAPRARTGRSSGASAFSLTGRPFARGDPG